MDKQPFKRVLRPRQKKNTALVSSQVQHRLYTFVPLTTFQNQGDEMSF